MCSGTHFHVQKMYMLGEENATESSDFLFLTYFCQYLNPKTTTEYVAALQLVKFRDGCFHVFLFRLFCPW